MTAASLQIFNGAGQPFVAREVELPRRLNPGEVLVEILLATICGSDLHTVDGRRMAPTPGVLGHEGIGRVLESDRPGVIVGQRVTWTLADSCGCCQPCLSWKLPQKCDRLFKYGHAPLNDGHGLNGCYASHLVLRAGTTIVAVPDDLPDSLVAPANCALATIVNALADLPQPCGRVLIQGAGLLGIYAAAWLKQQDVSEIFCVDLSSERLAAIARFGATPISAGQSLPAVDLVLEVAGTSQVIPAGLNNLRVGGHYVWAGMVHPQTPLAITGESIVKKCLTVRGVHNYRPEHLVAGLNFLRQNQARFPFQDLISPPLTLSQLNEAFELTRQQRWQRVSVKHEEY
jgi:putative phosphonate catabolism associated alcohol dehydrogenase